MLKVDRGDFYGLFSGARCGAAPPKSQASVDARAYEDSPQSIDYGATISAPHMHAYCLEWL